MGAGIIEISHRSKEFDAVLNRCDELLKELAGIPDNYKILYVHGGAQMQFSAVPLNLLGLSPSKSASYIETGTWGVKARKEAARYGNATTAASSADTASIAFPNSIVRACRRTPPICTLPATTHSMGRAGIASRRQVTSPSSPT